MKTLVSIIYLMIAYLFYTNEKIYKQRRTQINMMNCFLSSSSCLEKDLNGIKEKIKCENKTSCDQFDFIQTCYKINCTVCDNTLNKINKSYDNFNFYDVCSNSTNTYPCYSCLQINYNKNGSIIFNYQLPNFSKNITPELMSIIINNTFGENILKSKDLFYSNKCRDTRLTEVLNISQNNTEYEEKCQILVNDYSQFFLEYKCNNWFCNLQGNCSFIINNLYAVPYCTCNKGWRGRNCMFNDKDYTYAMNYSSGVSLWLNNYHNYTISNEFVYNSFINIVFNLLIFSGNAEEKDFIIINSIIKKIMNLLHTAAINYSDNSVKESLNNFLYSVMKNANFISSINPNFTSFILSKVLNGSIDLPKYGYHSSTINGSNGGLEIGISNLIYKKLSVNGSYMDMNNATPQMNISQSVLDNFESTTNFSITFIRYPINLIRTNDKFIHSFVITSRGFNNDNNINGLPLQEGNITFNIPWTFVPLIIVNGSYYENCEVLNYNGNNWDKINFCSITNITNENNANVECNRFDTIGISCKNARNFIFKSSDIKGISLNDSSLNLKDNSSNNFNLSINSNNLSNFNISNSINDINNQTIINLNSSENSTLNQSSNDSSTDLLNWNSTNMTIINNNSNSNVIGNVNDTQDLPLNDNIKTLLKNDSIFTNKNSTNTNSSNLTNLISNNLSDNLEIFQNKSTNTQNNISTNISNSIISKNLTNNKNNVLNTTINQNILINNTMVNNNYTDSSVKNEPINMNSNSVTNINNTVNQHLNLNTSNINLTNTDVKDNSNGDRTFNFISNSISEINPSNESSRPSTGSINNPLSPKDGRNKNGPDETIQEYFGFSCNISLYKLIMILLIVIFVL